MANQAADDTGGLRHGDDIALLAELCGLRDQLHRLVVEIAENVATPRRHIELAEWMGDVSVRLGRRGRRLALDRPVLER